MPNEFIRPCEAIKLLKISRETLRTNYAKMQIRRTVQKPFLYSKTDCLNFLATRLQTTKVFENPYLQKIRKSKKKTA